MAKTILLRAVLWLKLHGWLTENTATASLGIKSFPFLQPNTDNIFMAMGTYTLIPSEATPDELAQHQQRLQSTLAAWNFQSVPMHRDGDCFFYAIAFGLLQLAQNSSNEQALTVLRTLNSSQDNPDLDKLVTNLRRAIVAEWTGPNSQEYRSFLTASQLWSEAQRFLQRGVFSGELGDLVVTAAANAFQIPIVVFTSAASFPITTVMPTYKEAATAHPICVALTQYDGGHYDAVIRAAPSESHEELYGDSNQQSDKAPNCSCGRRNKGNKSMPCTNTEFGYRTRCPCHRDKRACTHQCKCKNCANEFGKTEAPDVPKAKRTRAHFSNQTFNLKGKRGEKFMKEAGENPKVGPWTDFEFLLAASIFRELDDSTSIDGDEFVSIADAIKSVAEALSLKIPMPQRSREEMLKLMRHCMHKSKETGEVLQ